MRKSRRTGKKRDMQRKHLLFLMIFLTVLLIVLLSVRGFAYADESIDNNRVKLYRSITIYAGDSLENLSTTYMTPEYADPMSYAKEVAFINHMNSDDKLIPGNHLIIPYYTDLQ
ncbi:MAG: hypothetical protein IKR47_09020 [Lachnospiraceae bacterium]|nr:hypothetical protein [Lachnospiraceae bacterium]